MLSAWRLWVMRAIENLVVRFARAPHRAMRRGCHGDTNEMPAEYDRVSVLVKLNRMSTRPGHHASARTRHCAQPRSTPDQKTRVSTMTRSGVDGGEHSATLDRVMAGALFVGPSRYTRCRSWS